MSSVEVYVLHVKVRLLRGPAVPRAQVIWVVTRGLHQHAPRHLDPVVPSGGPAQHAGVPTTPHEAVLLGKGSERGPDAQDSELERLPDLGVVRGRPPPRRGQVATWQTPGCAFRAGSKAPSWAPATTSTELHSPWQTCPSVGSPDPGGGGGPGAPPAPPAGGAWTAGMLCGPGNTPPAGGCTAAGRGFCPGSLNRCLRATRPGGRGSHSASVITRKSRPPLTHLRPGKGGGRGGGRGSESLTCI